MSGAWWTAPISDATPRVAYLNCRGSMSRFPRIACLGLGWLSAITVLLALPLPLMAEEGERSCVECHDETDAYPVLAITKTRHAVVADERTPFANGECRACHGPSNDHARRARRFKPHPAGAASSTPSAASKGP